MKLLRLQDLILILICFVIMSGCQSDNIDETNGKLEKTIKFNITANKEDLDIFPKGVIPWVSLDNPEPEIRKMKDPDERVLINKNVFVIIDYPLKKPAKFELKSEDGFTRAELIMEISRLYHQIYMEEEETSKIKTIPIKERKKLLNRNETNDKYSIWGHDLRDLDLSTIRVMKKTNGEMHLYLDIES